MTYHVFFSFSQGFAKSITAPKGTLASINAHVREVEETLGIERTQYNDNPVRWDHWNPDFRAGFPDVEDKILCETVQKHNDWVRRLYKLIGTWAQDPVKDGETITPEDAAEFWPGLTLIDIRPDRWTDDYYRNRMEHLYEVMRGRPDEGVSFRATPLTPEQAGDVIHLFEKYLDPGDMRLEVPKDCDHLADNEEYDWCERCGAVPHETADGCRKRGCPVQANWCEEDRPEWFEEGEEESAPDEPVGEDPQSATVELDPELAAKALAARDQHLAEDMNDQIGAFNAGLAEYLRLLQSSSGE